jgi:hypothetical protein
MSPQDAIGHYQILTSMLAPALLMAATGSLLVSANARLARVVDRLRSLVALWNSAGDVRRKGLDQQIERHRRRARYVLRACVMLYAAVASFVGTSLALAGDAISGQRLPLLPTGHAVAGVLCLFVACVYLCLEVFLAVSSFDEELELEIHAHEPAPQD